MYNFIPSTKPGPSGRRWGCIISQTRSRSYLYLFSPNPSVVRRQSGVLCHLYSYCQPVINRLTFAFFLTSYSSHSLSRTKSSPFAHFPWSSIVTEKLFIWEVPQMYNYLPSPRILESHATRSSSFINSTSPSTKWSFIKLSSSNTSERYTTKQTCWTRCQLP
jgi:hypothetical protein